jgi:hypothetical protein
MTQAEELDFKQAAVGDTKMVYEAAVEEVKGSVKTSQIVWGVFTGMWLFALSFSLVYYMWSNYMRHGNLLY